MIGIDPALLGPGPICVGFSGGGDSTALLHSLRRSFPERPVHALIVDHGVQAGSADIAAQAAASACAAGAEATILRLDQAGAGHAQWRRARYAGLIAATRTRGGDRLWLGHTADDQAETVLMRMRRGSGWRGLAGMARLSPAPFWPDGRGIWLVRPLLHERRLALRDRLETARLTWLDDPANADPRFARPQARLDLSRTPGAVDQLCRFAMACSDARRHEDDAVQAFCADLTITPMGQLEVPLAAWLALPIEQRVRALQVLLAVAAGVELLAAWPNVRRLAFRLKCGAAAGTLGGGVARARGGVLRFERDPGAVCGRSRLPGIRPQDVAAAAVWDGRFAITPLVAGLKVAPLGHPPDPTAPAIAGLSADLAELAGLARVRPLAAERLATLLWRSFTPP
jgi:tRNA(Ile)-lysidine synthase